MAATRPIALHIGEGKNLAKALNARLDYSQNPDKTDSGELISSYECSPGTAAEEFLLSKRQITNIVKNTTRKLNEEQFDLSPALKELQLWAESSDLDENEKYRF